MNNMINQYRKDVKIIPMGQNCMPRTILTRWGLKKTKIFGEITYPFDIAVFETREITHSLKTDFEEFLYNLNYRPNRKIWVKEPDCIEFVHETNFGEKDKEKLVNKYLERIENFKTAVKSAEPILFVQILGDCSDIENLYAELKKIRTNNSFRYAVIDTQDITKPVEGIDILKLSFPYDEYKQNWWKKQYYSSEAGMKFEEKIVEFIKEIISSMQP